MRWRLKDLVVWLDQTHGIRLDETTVGRVLKALGYRKLSARPRHHAQDKHAIEDFKKVSPAAIEAVKAKLLSTTVIEIWWQDEARVGQKNGITRRWAKKGTRPSRLTISAPLRPICSGRSVPKPARPPASFCRVARPPP